jgi:hypothetical protein
MAGRMLKTGLNHERHAALCDTPPQHVTFPQGQISTGPQSVYDNDRTGLTPYEICR